jgi:phenylpropionate dioxygenase-like ring-hydroxylating dioxygenase large terminal subunit
MAGYLRNAWYQAAWSNEIEVGQRLSRTLLDETLLLYRMEDGKVVAMNDRCPHRFAPLSRGTIRNGVLYCGYHGLGFGASGECVFNPHGPVPKAARVTTYPVVERHDGIWIWMGVADSADETKMPDLSFIDQTPALAKLTGYIPTAANYQLLTDNIMDLSHADFLHPTTLGGCMTDAQVKIGEQGGRIEVRWTSSGVTPPSILKPSVPHGAADTWFNVVWSPPAVMVLNVGAVAAGVVPVATDQTYTLHNMTPATAVTTHYFYCTTRAYRTDDAEYTAFLKRVMEKAFLEEDKPMIEAQQRTIQSEDIFGLKPVLLNVDTAAVRVRKQLQKLQAAEL